MVNFMSRSIFKLSICNLKVVLKVPLNKTAIMSQYLAGQSSSIVEIFFHIKH